ncbi:NFATC2-interacting protein-like [Selaginella moellendorffii]|uniref:NFATC2-interacting protein-like n=1 Tax=Selaginella moellendorffii TaxID=88036 RepID=UPI000D1C84AF|nr:NFATC2-interacting protein-like [Selaginella moellendorffii]XP_024518326.1 NFATC2-interacting protein-like [Selaginella moellendorffii]|eukprot:XP_024518325.1 NFATC2-interacting protein-like [Selaginella moellendorffii]
MRLSSANFTVRQATASPATTQQQQQQQQLTQRQRVVEEDREWDRSWLPPPPKLTKKVTATTSFHGVSSLLRAKQAELLSLSQKACEDIDELDRRAKAYTPAQAADKIVVRVQDSSGGIQCIRMGMDDRLDKLFDAYSTAAKVSVSGLVFCFDGEQVQGSATPRSMNLENEDMLEVSGQSCSRDNSDHNSQRQQQQQQHKIVLKVQDKSGGIHSFRMGMDDRFERLFAAYASTTKTSKSNLVFRFDGEQLQGNATPKSLDMEDDDSIEVFVRS